MKAFEELGKLDPPDPSLHFANFTFILGGMTGNLIKEGKLTNEDAKEVADEINNFESVEDIMERIWPNQ